MHSRQTAITLFKIVCGLNQIACILYETIRSAEMGDCLVLSMAWQMPEVCYGDTRGLDHTFRRGCMAALHVAVTAQRSILGTKHLVAWRCHTAPRVNHRHQLDGLIGQERKRNSTRKDGDKGSLGLSARHILATHWERKGRYHMRHTSSKSVA